MVHKSRRIPIMSKADVLLKKASSFEKLALYSDRKNFLQAIAQTTVDQFPPASNQGVNAPYMPGTAPSVNTKPFQVPSNKYLPGPGWDKIPEQSLDKPTTIPPIPEETVAPAATTSPSSPAAVKNYGDPETVKLLQTFLASSLGSFDVLGPKGIDGKLGVRTLDALKQWGQKNNIKTQDITDLLNIALNQSGYSR